MADIQQRVDRLNEYGYRCIRIYKNLYLIRLYGKSRKISPYHFRKLDEVTV